MLTRYLQAIAWTAGAFAAAWICGDLLLDSSHGAELSRFLGYLPGAHQLEIHVELAVLLAVGTGVWMLIGGGPLLVTGLALKMAVAAVRRQPTNIAQEVGCAVSGALLLTAWMLLYGASPLFVAWDAVIIAGMAASVRLLAARTRIGRENGNA